MTARLPSMWRRIPRGTAAVTVALLAFACSPGDLARTACHIVQPLTPLPRGLEETSGVVISQVHDGILWTHNDSGGEPEVVAVRANGELVGRVRVEGARARDWEDLALGPCPSGLCLHVADTGDGNAQRPEIGVYRLPEPDPGDERSHTAEHFPARYPDGPRDAEALFVTGEGEFYLVTKGRAEPAELYRYPRPLRPGEVVTLEFVRNISGGPLPLEEQVTGASASPSGELVAIRSYKRLRIWRTTELLAGGGPQLTADLYPLGEVQGEAVALLDNGGVVVTTEGGFPGAAGMVAVLACNLDG